MVLKAPTSLITPAHEAQFHAIQPSQHPGENTAPAVHGMHSGANQAYHIFCLQKPSVYRIDARKQSDVNLNNAPVTSFNSLAYNVEKNLNTKMS